MRNIAGWPLSAGMIDELSAELRVYDVDQGGWEHEPKGLKFNAEHVLKEVVRARRKDMLDPAVVVSELAPDAVQYALRLGRWAGVAADDMLPGIHTRTAAAEHGSKYKVPQVYLSSWALAEITLADFTHSLDHKSERARARKAAARDLGRCAGHMLHFVEVAAVTHSFSVQDSFRSRLASLRERFGIPQPAE